MTTVDLNVWTRIYGGIRAGTRVNNPISSLPCGVPNFEHETARFASSQPCRNVCVAVG